MPSRNSARTVARGKMLSKPARSLPNRSYIAWRTASSWSGGWPASPSRDGVARSPTATSCSCSETSPASAMRRCRRAVSSCNDRQRLRSCAEGSRRNNQRTALEAAACISQKVTGTSQATRMQPPSEEFHPQPRDDDQKGPPTHARTRTPPMMNGGQRVPRATFAYAASGHEQPTAPRYPRKTRSTARTEPAVWARHRGSHRGWKLLAASTAATAK